MNINKWLAKIALTVALIVIATIIYFYVSNVVGLFVLRVIQGFLVGQVQWLIIRRQVRRSKRLVLATSVGWFVGILDTAAIANPYDMYLFPILWVVFSFMLLGVSLIMIWPLVTTMAIFMFLSTALFIGSAVVGYTVGAQVGILVGVVTAILVGVVAAILVGVITGKIMVWVSPYFHEQD